LYNNGIRRQRYSNNQTISIYIHYFIIIIIIILQLGDLQAVIKKHIQDNTLIEETLIWNWFLQTCHAVGYIHERNILHRDIKSQNIFINKEGEV